MDDKKSMANTEKKPAKKRKRAMWVKKDSTLLCECGSYRAPGRRRCNACDYLCDHFAAAALSGMLSNSKLGSVYSFDEIAGDAFLCAGAMIVARREYGAMPTKTPDTILQQIRPSAGKGDMGASSEHFTIAELECKCGCMTNGCKPGLTRSLEEFRRQVGDKEVIIDSAYRCEKHNKAVGGKPDSWHLKGLAADVRVHDMTAEKLEAAAIRTRDVNGIGRADAQGYVHLDLRPSKYITRWCYNVAGEVVEYFASGHTYRCQFCSAVTPAYQWLHEGYQCPFCLLTLNIAGH